MRSEIEFCSGLSELGSDATEMDLSALRQRWYSRATTGQDDVRRQRGQFRGVFANVVGIARGRDQRCASLGSGPID